MSIIIAKPDKKSNRSYRLQNTYIQIFFFAKCASSISVKKILIMQPRIINHDFFVLLNSNGFNLIIFIYRFVRYTKKYKITIDMIKEPAYSGMKYSLRTISISKTLNTLPKKTDMKAAICMRTKK